jgi:dUTP pyrophosphatase
MDLDTIDKNKKSKLTPEEKEHLKKAGACFFCCQTGHIATKCPKKTAEPKKILVLSKDTQGQQVKQEVELNFMRVNPKAQIPQPQSEGAIGLDLQAVQQVTIPAHERRLIPTGLAVEIPKEHYARIAPRSGLSVKHSLDVGAGVIDPDFRGEMQVLLVNHKNQPYTVNEGDRIAQLILE